ncbi:bifunctional 2-C-methyl-D-erythritol 4-phosphate cytidylyltransferase/2-C-methyl-D-erythritol 2,4-cyclodiphosphate synthase [Caulobacter sp. BE254]|uniref:bifunctional 2-C-methyl-D-erythritol 4-phosphate cytidylyltransferase/2-C-methyl-D-erythritol 2,4-cyclodiphosphate synthase n=1 Tax=Caulobacter sp. BE254 TaxID=2817720 RepID=UPI002858128F|nr:bifunctional 2-C-methyl-D-erythritol 4-phosphate cytidylyltransferase/2-C-methyl-D-erythritol 2,4-cyclodiphosphate synthase [Caulobacter sp. BE254]MDR7114220.1 2-C-methyl-D-erythritol 4-phosphate cytidylyltransferase/2-C-methyl-D-erythritol 2,4-cyclodiphosphate synthase [Caulobacter sp. BE254]
MSFSAVIVAAGSGTRAGPGQAKQWRMLAGKPVLRWSVETFINLGAQDVVIVADLGARTTLGIALAGLEGWTTVAGGATRALSVRAGLAALAARPADEPVLVHDAARPFLGAATIQAVLKGLENADGAIPALPVADTLKSGAADGAVVTTPRDNLWRAQTPQGFRRDRLLAAYAAWTGPSEPTDDGQVVEQDGGRVVVVPGDPMLMKLTYPEDFAMAETLAGRARVTRMGQGFDAHRWGPHPEGRGESVWLCGVEIAHDETLIGHSDADAGLHALTDAILGAIGEGDIGDHFPPTDPQWKGASSDRFLAHAVDLVRQRGGTLVNVDVTLICERPKIKPHRAAMRERLAQILDLPLNRVSVKATTTEGMGFTGRGEGLAAQAIAVVETPA